VSTIFLHGFVNYAGVLLILLGHRISIVIEYLTENILYFAHPVFIFLGHHLLLVSQFFVFVGLEIDAVHGIF